MFNVLFLFLHHRSHRRAALTRKTPYSMRCSIVIKAKAKSSAAEGKALHG